MRNYKDETISKLCAIINCLEDNGCLLDEDITEYRNIVSDYVANLHTEETLDAISLNYASYANCYILKDTTDGEVIVKAYDEDKADMMMRDVSKHICFSDCDGTFHVEKIVYHGREVEYVGWRPNMVYEYVYRATGDTAWEEAFPELEH